MNRHTSLRGYIGISITAYLLITILSLIILNITEPSGVIMQGPLSDPGITAIYLVAARLLVGSVLILGYLKIISVKTGGFFRPFISMLLYI